MASRRRSSAPPAADCELRYDAPGTISCPKCAHLCCASCAQQWIMQRELVLCPHGCGQVWYRGWVEQTLPKKFVQGDFKNREKNLVLARQRLLFDEVQLDPRFEVARVLRDVNVWANSPNLPRAKFGAGTKAIMDALCPGWFSQTWNKAYKQLALTEQDGLDAFDWTREFMTQVEPLFEAMNEAMNHCFERWRAAHPTEALERFRCHVFSPGSRARDHPLIWVPAVREAVEQRRRAALDRGEPLAVQGAVLPEKKQGRPCPHTDCLGLVVGDNYCLACRGISCPHCWTAIPLSPGELAKAGHDRHRCDPNILASVNLIKHDTKPCPHCRKPIFRPFGCDHMWCQQCETGFDWTTMEIMDTSRGFSNPEFARARAAERRAAAQTRGPGAPAPLLELDPDALCPEDALGDREQLVRDYINADTTKRTSFWLTCVLVQNIPAFIHQLELRVPTTNRDLITCRLLGAIDQTKYEKLTVQRDRVARQVDEEISFLQAFRFRAIELIRRVGTKEEMKAVRPWAQKSEMRVVTGLDPLPDHQTTSQNLVDELVAAFDGVKKTFGVASIKVSLADGGITMSGHATGLAVDTLPMIGHWMEHLPSWF